MKNSITHLFQVKFDKSIYGEEPYEVKEKKQRIVRILKWQEEKNEWKIRGKLSEKEIGLRTETEMKEWKTTESVLEKTC